MRAAAAGTLPHGIDEFFVRPGADARHRIGRDVRCEQISERRLDRATAGEGMTAAGKRVASSAISDNCQITAALQLLEILHVDTGPHDRTAG